MKTELVLSIFGGERCVTTLEDLEAAAHAIHTKAVRERTAQKRNSSHRGADSAQPPERQSETRANPSTLSAEIEGQIRLINAESGPCKTETPTP